MKWNSLLVHCHRLLLHILHERPNGCDRNEALDQAAYSPAHFAARFGRSPVWAYRLLYGGKVKAITGFGRILIPRSELERLLATAATYIGEAARKRVLPVL
jgi:hypothetical protein